MPQKNYDYFNPQYYPTLPLVHRRVANNDMGIRSVSSTCVSSRTVGYVNLYPPLYLRFAPVVQSSISLHLHASSTPLIVLPRCRCEHRRAATGQQRIRIYY